MAGAGHRKEPSMSGSLTAKDLVLIKKVVAENTTSDTASPSAEAQNSLIKYLKNPLNVDSTYLTIIERVGDKPNEVVLLRSVKLLKTYLPKYTPADDTLKRLDGFCQGVTSSNEAINKSILYIRALISKLLGATGASPSGRKSIEVLTPRSRIAAGDTGPADKDARALLERRLPPPQGVTVYDFLLYRLAAAAPGAPQFATMRKNTGGVPGTLLSSLLFGGQFKFAGSDSPPPAPSADTLLLDNVAQVHERVKTVSVEKKKEEQKMLKEAGQQAARRRAPQLFQYKYYKEQAPLALTPAEFDKVVNAVVRPPASDHESHLIASKILIKLLIDMYCGDEKKATQLTTTILFEMLASSQMDIRLHGFNLLFNLSVHMNLLDETALLGDGGAGNGTPAGRNQIEVIQEELLQVCDEMLLWLIQHEVEDEKIWATGLNCLLYFVTNDGHVNEKKLCMVDLRLFPAFIRNLGGARDMLHRKIIRMLVPRLYDGALSQALLRKAGGIHFICSQYAVARSTESIDNLFLVVSA